MDGSAAILLFALDDLRAGFLRHAAAGVDPRHDTAPFRAFRAALLDALAAAASGEAELSMWWEGSYDAYALAIAVAPPEALSGLAGAEAAAARACPVDAARLAPPRRDRYPLARLAPGRHALLRDEAGALVEAPFGAPTGHFGAPGMRRLA